MLSTSMQNGLTPPTGKTLSLQRHQFRDEHWTIVQGTGTVTLDDEEFEKIVD